MLKPSDNYDVEDYSKVGQKLLADAFRILNKITSKLTKKELKKLIDFEDSFDYALISVLQNELKKREGGKNHD